MKQEIGMRNLKMIGSLVWVRIHILEESCTKTVILLQEKYSFFLKFDLWLQLLTSSGLQIPGNSDWAWRESYFFIYKSKST